MAQSSSSLTSDNLPPLQCSSRTRKYYCFPRQHSTARIYSSYPSRVYNLVFGASYLQDTVALSHTPRRRDRIFTFYDSDYPGVAGLGKSPFLATPILRNRWFFFFFFFASLFFERSKNGGGWERCNSVYNSKFTNWVMFISKKNRV